MLNGVTKLNLDVKGRLAIPSRYRERLQEDCAGRLVVTLDPERDTIEQMMHYKQDLHPSFRMLTGTPGQIDAIAKAFRVYYSKAEDEDDPENYLLDHSIVFYLLDDQGEFVDFFTQSANVNDIARKIKDYR